MAATSTSSEARTLHWHKVAEPDDLPDGRVRTVTVGTRSLALTRVGERYGVLDNHCPHQGGPLGEGSIEQGLLRCPWHVVSRTTAAWASAPPRSSTP